MQFEIELINSLIKGDFTLFGSNQLKRMNFKRFLKICSVNRLLYAVALALHRNESPILGEKERSYIEKVFKEGELQIKRYLETLKWLKETFEKNSIDWLLIKTDKDIAYVVNDIDILVRESDFKLANTLVNAKWGKVISRKPNQVHVITEGLCKIDLHNSFSQLNTSYIDNEELWQNPVKKEFRGVRYSTPSFTSETSMIILNSLFGSFHIPLLDCFFIKNNLKKINFEEMGSQAKKYGWAAALQIYISVLKYIFSIMFQKDEWERYFPNLANERMRGQLRLPYVFTCQEILRIFKERGSRLSKQDFFMLAYYSFAKLRYRLTNGTRVPIHNHWFNFY